MVPVIKIALHDLHAGLKMRRVWITLAQEDISDQHRRTTLGPLWLLINYLAFAGTFIFIFQRGDSGASNYPAYVATGLLVWFYIMETLTQSASLFIREKNFINGTKLPLSVYVMRLFMQTVIREGYALMGCLGILLVSGINLTIFWGFSIIAIILILLITPAVIIVFAFMGAWLSDSVFIVSNLMRVGMFLTPVFWVYKDEGGIREAFYFYNPFTYFLEIVRIPIVAGDVPFRSFLVCIMIGLFFWGIAIYILGRFRRQLNFII